MSTIKYTINNKYFSLITEENSYWAGVFAADGCVFYNRGVPAIQLGFQAQDREHLENLKKLWILMENYTKT
jgi:hypothetical protein